MSTRRRAFRWIGPLLVGLVALATTGGFVVFAGAVGHGLWSQSDAATRFVPTPATVATSQVKTSRGSKGKTKYRAEILFDYQVDGRSYRASRDSFTMAFGSDRERTARAKVAADPVGAARTVFVDPRDPTRMVRRTDIRGKDLLSVLLLIPFAGFVALLWTILPRLLRGGDDRTGGVRVREDGRSTIVRLASVSPATSAAIAAIVFGFLAFVGGMALPADVSTGVVAALGGAAVILSTAVYWFSSIRAARGVHDLVLDRDMQVVRLPARAARRLRRERDIPFRDIHAIELRTRKVATGHGTVTLHDVMVAVGEGGTDEARPTTVLVATDRTKAQQFGTWLAGEVGAIPPAEESTAPSDDELEVEPDVDDPDDLEARRGGRA